MGDIKKSDGVVTTITLGRYTFDENGKETLMQNAKDFSNSIIIESYFTELVESREGVASYGADGVNTTALNLKGFINSVSRNKGYYIARYEASYGIDKKANSKVSNKFSETVEPTEEGALWNMLYQKDAAKACRYIYGQNNASIETDLTNSYAWDTAISYMQKCSNNSNYARQNSKNTSLANTGTINDEICKVNDLASNIREYVTENSNYLDAHTSRYCVNRGGNYFNSSRYTSIRITGPGNETSAAMGFRSILYLIDNIE